MLLLIQVSNSSKSFNKPPMELCKIHNCPYDTSFARHIIAYPLDMALRAKPILIRNYVFVILEMYLKMFQHTYLLDTNLNVKTDEVTNKQQPIPCPYLLIQEDSGSLQSFDKHSSSTSL